MAAVTLYDGETGATLGALDDEASPGPAVVGLHDAGVVLFVDPGADAALLRFAVEEGERHVVARVELADDDELSDVYRAVQGRVQGYGEAIAHPREVPGALNLVHYLAAPRPDPPDRSVRGHLIATDQTISVEVPTAADAAGILAFFRERAPWKSLLVSTADAEPATGDADVTITVDDSLDGVTYHGRDESWADGDASVEALPEDDRAETGSGRDGGIEASADDATSADDASASAGASPANETTASAATGPRDQSDGTAERADEGAADESTADEGAADPGADEGGDPIEGGDSDAERAGSTAADREQSSERSLAPHHERQFEEAVADLRDDLVAIADQVDSITGTVQARQRVFAATLSGAVLADRGLTAVPADDRRLSSRRRQVRSLTLSVLVASGLVAGVLSGWLGALEPLLAEQFVLDLGTEPLPVRGIVIAGPVLAVGSPLLVGAVALWLLSPGATPRAGLAALAARLREQVTVVGSGTVPKSLRSRAEAVQADLDDLEDYVETLAGREGASPTFETAVEQQLLATPGLPDVELLDRGTRRRALLATVAQGLLVGAAGAVLVLGVLGGAVALAASRPALALDALAGLAAVALIAAVAKGGLLAWQSGRPSADTVGVLGSPPATGSDGRSDRSEAGGGTEGPDETAVGPATETRERNYDRPEGRSPGKGAGSSGVAVTAPAYEHGERERPVVRERSNRSWRLLLSSLAFLVIVGVDIAVFRGPLTVPDAVPDLLAVSVMVLAPIVLAILVAVYWVLDV